MLKKNWLVFTLSLFLLSSSAYADEATVKKALEAKLEGAQIISVTKTPYLGLYEVRLDDQLIYTDEKVTYIFAGNIIDAKTLRNLTVERMRKLAAIKFDSLPLNLAIKHVKGNGQRKVAVFSDPDCPYCKQFEKSLVNVTDVTIYTFLYPIDSLHPGATEKSKAIWCSADPAKAWDDLMLNGTQPKSVEKCDTPLATIAQLGQRNRITGTPTLVFADGQVIPGAIPVEQLEKLLEANKPK